MDSACWFRKKEKQGPRLFRPSAWEDVSASPTRSTRRTTGCRERPTSLWAHSELFLQLPREESSRGLGMAHAMTASPKQSFRAPCRVSDSVVGRGNEWTSLPMPDCRLWPPTEETGRGFLLNRRSCGPDHPINQMTELNWMMWCYCLTLYTGMTFIPFMWYAVTNGRPWFPKFFLLPLPFWSCHRSLRNCRLAGSFALVLKWQ